MTKEKNTQFIDDWFDEIEDPIVSNMNLIGMIESWIPYTIFDDNEKQRLIEKLFVLKESEVSSFIEYIKDHRFFPDPKDQFKQMADRGVFMDFADQN